MDQWSCRHVHPLIFPSCVYMWLSRLKLFPVIWSAQLTGLSINSRECRPDLMGFFLNNVGGIEKFITTKLFLSVFSPLFCSDDLLCTDDSNNLQTRCYFNTVYIVIFCRSRSVLSNEHLHTILIHQSCQKRAVNSKNWLMNHCCDLFSTAYFHNACL